MLYIFFWWHFLSLPRNFFHSISSLFCFCIRTFSLNEKLPQSRFPHLADVSLTMCFLWTHKKVRKQPNVIWYEQTAELAVDHNSRNGTKLCRLRRFPFFHSQPTLLLFCFTTVVVCFGVLCFLRFWARDGNAFAKLFWYIVVSCAEVHCLASTLDVIVHSIVLAFLMDLLWLEEAAILFRFPCAFDFLHILYLYEYAKSENLYAKSYPPLESQTSVTLAFQIHPSSLSAAGDVFSCEKHSRLLRCWGESYWTAKRKRENFHFHKMNIL